MTWNLIRLSEAPASPWRNGGGITRELAAGPSPDDWAWRISVADVSADGPFSHFPGVQRWFAVVRGAGVHLVVDDQPHEVVAASAPLAFDGAAAVDSRLVAGPTQDLNLMLRRDRATGLMTRLEAPRRFTTSAAGVLAVYALDTPARVRGPAGGNMEVPPHSLAWAQLAAGSEVDIETRGALCMEITPRG